MSAADHNLSVLVVSDDSQVMAGVRRRLEQRGHRVCSVTTAAAAEATALDTPFDVVVCDTHLPDGDGRRFGAELARRRSLPGIAIDESSDRAAVRESFAAGMMAHVAKPQG